MTTMPSTPRPHRAPARLLRGLGAALTLCATLPLAASAQAAPIQVVTAGSGMTLPAGVAETTDGSLWVADQALGVCRVRTGAAAELVPSPYCGPEPATDFDPPRLGPETANQLAFDPASSNFFVAEGDSHGAGVWRMHWNAETNAIDAAQRIVSMGENRVFALALGTNPDGTVYVDFNGRDDATIRRLQDAESDR
jgi:streptogramin lyase